MIKSLRLHKRYLIWFGGEKGKYLLEQILGNVADVLGDGEFKIHFALVFDDDFLLSLRVDIHGTEVNLRLRYYVES